MQLPLWKPALLQLYRLAVLVGIAWMVHELHLRLRIDGDTPLAVTEVTSFYPKAKELKLDHSERMGMFVLDDAGQQLGYVVRTMPMSAAIIGYAGPTDTLIALDNEFKVLGIKIRKSEDTRTHVADVATDRHFMKTWNGMNWDKVAGLDLQKAGIEGVSGATKTSLAVAESITYRMKLANDKRAYKAVVKIRSSDIGLAVVIVLALVMAFTHLRGRKWMRRVFQVVVFGYIGLLNGDLIAQSLLAGWTKASVPWETAPGMALLVAAAFLVPLTAKRPLYCLHICPHGAAQEWLGRLRPAWRLRLPDALARGLEWLPGALLIVVLVTVMLQLPIDLATIEPFDAYVIRSAGWATIAIAIAGLIASIFIPQAYCKYGCPTGALLEFVRSHGAQDRFGRRDIFAAVMLVLTVLLYGGHGRVMNWIYGPA
jgi:NosR/NirI family nitrous oxide reductase transcriptional regulator